MPFDAYKTYLALKNHFTKPEYDYHKYCGKSRATLQSFYKRKDRFWFEKLSRQKDDKEVIDFFVANFVYSDDPSTLWIGNIIREGDSHYKNWQKKIQSLSYIFKDEIESCFSGRSFDSLFEIDGSRHPEIIKMHLRKEISIETLLILEKILGYKKKFDSKLNDPIWNIISMKMNKYYPFLNIDVFRFKRILKEVVVGQ